MKYPIILKYKYSYVISGNNYKEAIREYYQLFIDKNNFKMVSIDSPSDIKVNLIKHEHEQITFTYHYHRYCKPNTFNYESELITTTHSLNKGESVSIKCVETYWAYAKGGENGLATLTVSWISYEQFINEILLIAKEDKYSAVKAAKVLINEGIYDIAFNLLLGTNMNSYELGLCYEKGYGTDIDLDKALDIYLDCNNRDADRGIERIYEIRGKKIHFDKVKRTILYEERGQYQDAYSSSVIPTEISDNTLKDLRRNVELRIICFLELGRPFNDPFNRPTDTMCKLATYYDVINNIKEEEKVKYHSVEYEDDPYDGGSFRYDIYHDDLIVKTLQKEVSKNDVIALGSLLVQFGIHPSTSNFSGYLLENLEEIKTRLNNIGSKENDKDSGMAYYFLGLYHERIAKKAYENYEHDYYINNKTYTYTGDNIEKDLQEFLIENKIKEDGLSSLLSTLYSLHNRLSKGNDTQTVKKLENFIIYLYNKKHDFYSKIENENLDIANNYYKLSLNKGFHLSIAHLANEIVKNNSKEEALKILQVHEQYIPLYLTYSSASKYHSLLKKLKEE